MRADAEPTALLADLPWLRLLAQRLAGAADGDDLTQEAVMVALGKDLPEGAGLRPWLVVTARNLWRRRRRDDLRRRGRHAALEAPEPPTTAEAALERLDTLAALAALVRELPDPYRATVLARYFEGKSAVQIAAETGVPAGTVRWRLKEALERLRAALDEREGGDRRRWAVLFLPAARPARALSWSGPMLAVPAAAMIAVAVTVALPLARGPRAHSGGTSRAPMAASPPAAVRPVRLTLVPEATPAGSASLAGVVRDPEGRSVAGAMVALFPTRATTLATAPAQIDRLEGRSSSDGEGRFVLEGRLPGEYVLTAAHERFGPAQVPLTLGAGERRTAELRLGGGGELLSGTVRDSGAGPIIGARVTAEEFPGRGPRLRFGAITGAGGRYALRLPRGHWHVSASADGYAYGWTEVVLEGPSVSELVLPASGGIGGRVVDGATGVAVAGAIVRLDRPGASAGRTTTTDTSGFFSFGTAWPPGPFRLTATADDRAGRIELPAPADAAVRSPIQLNLRPGLAISGRVAGPRAQPLAGAAVQVFDGSRQIQPTRVVTTDAAGRYRIGGLLPGQTWIGIEASGLAPERRLVTAGASADFALGSQVTLAGLVTSADGRPLRQVELQLTLLRGPDAGAPLLAFRRVPLGPQGTFRIEGLAAGTFLVEVQTRDDGSGRFQGTLGPGEHRQVTWRLAGTWTPDGRGRDSLVVGPF